MGCQSSSESTGTAEAKARNAEIDAQLAKEKQTLKREIKLLFLGAGESGKSTMIKQMRYVYDGPMKDAERAEYAEIIFHNIVKSMQVLIDAFELLQIKIPPKLGPYTDYIARLGAQSRLTGATGGLDRRVAEAVAIIWKFSGAREAVRLSHEFQLDDSAPYFFDAIGRIASPSYKVTDQDIFRARVKSTGISEVSFMVNGLRYRCTDVGGQRSERKKWVHCFQDVQVLIFVAAISEYNQMLYEDESLGRTAEALTIWKSIANSRWFSKTSIVLFLNKIDLFQAKLKLYRFSEYVEDYHGDNSYASTTTYLKNAFLSLNKDNRRELYHHFTCATDTSQIRLIMATVNEQILSANLRESGMM